MGELTGTLALYYQDGQTPAASDIALASFIGDIWFDVDLHNEYEELRQPDELDDEQLRASVADRLSRWDAGTYPPDLI